MANLAIPTTGRLGSSWRRLPKNVLVAVAAIVVLALMALSFVVGGATIGSHGATKPVSSVSVQAQPPQSAAQRLECHRHEQC
jgi:hypothetical protein